MADSADVYELLKSAIQAGEFLPGHRLTEAELSEKLNAPRAKVRSALFLLEHDGLIEHKRHRGATVRAVEPEEAREIIETRSVLEGLAARRAAENATASDDEALVALIEEMRERLDAGMLTPTSEVNMRVHEAVLRVSGQKTIARLVESLNGNLVRYRYHTSFALDRPERSFAEHKAILDAIVDRNPAAAEQAMRFHLDQVQLTMSNESMINV